jgi:hypothetical protein
MRSRPVQEALVETGWRRRSHAGGLRQVRVLARVPHITPPACGARARQSATAIPSRLMAVLIRGQHVGG